MFSFIQAQTTELDHVLALDLQREREGQTTSPQPAAPPLAPSNQLNGVHTLHWRHKEDKLSQVSNLSSSWGRSPSSGYLSVYNYLCLALAVTHCLVCPPAPVMDEAGHISHTHTQSDSHTVAHLWERLVRVIKAQCSAHRESEGCSVWLDSAPSGRVTMHFFF